MSKPLRSEPPLPESFLTEPFFKDGSQPVVALASRYPDGHVIAPHRHRRGQLLHGFSGVVMVGTAQGAWAMPPRHGMWIPPGVTHEVRALGEVEMHSLYFDPGVVAAMPRHCQAVGLSPLMQSLIAEAMRLPADQDTDGRAAALMALVRHELLLAPALPLSLPFPSHARLAARCRDFLRRPTLHETIDQWSAALGMSRRSFTRLFVREAGMTFVGWRQQACLFAALPRLAAGDAVTTIALDLGYQNPAAFTAMFKRVLGAAPRAYARQGQSAGTSRLIPAPRPAPEPPPANRARSASRS